MKKPNSESQSNFLKRLERLVLLALFTGFAPYVFAQSPGGVSGANLWLKADAGTIPASGTLTSWTDQTVNNTITVSGNPQTGTASVNFNNAITFNGSSDYLETPSAPYLNSTNFTLSIATKIKVGAAGNDAVVSSRPNGGNEGFAVYANTNGTNTTWQLWAKNGSGSYAQLLSSPSVPNGNWHVLTVKYDGSAFSLYVDGQSAGAPVSVSFTPNSGMPFYIGAGTTGGTTLAYHYEGEISEVVYYPTSLSNIDKGKVESYLASKYGISLGNNTDAALYYDSQGNIYWPGYSTFKFDIFGVGKDDNSALDQTSSNSMNTGSGDGKGQSGKGNIVLSNASSLEDGDFLIIGHDNAALTGQNTDLPTGANPYRIAREWKIKRTGDAGTVTLKFDLAGTAIAGSIGTATTDFNIIIDEDGNGDFTNGTVTKVNPNTVSGTLLTFDALTLPDGAVFSFSMNLSATWLGTTNTDWNTATNWATGAVPAATDNVVINDVANDPVINPGISANVNNLTVNAGGSLTIKSDATGTGSLIIAGTATGDVSVERYLPEQEKWYLISSPVKDILQTTFGAAYADASGLQYAIGNYNENGDTWGYATQGATNELDIAKGYSIKGKTGVSTLVFTGPLQVGNTQGILNKNGYGWNLVGNPFTSAIKAKGAGGFLADNSLKIHSAYQGLYLWDHTANDYVVIAESGFTFPAPGGEAELSQNNIAVGQGFFVKAEAAGLVDFNASQQLHATTTTFKSAEVPNPAVRLSVTSGDKMSRTVAGFATGLTPGLDPGYDVGKFKSSLALYSRLIDGSSAVDFEIQGLENKDYTSLTVPLGLDFTGGEATFTLEANSAFPAGAKVYIEDTQLATHTLLNTEAALYKVTLPALRGSNRFNLVITGYKSGQISTGVEIEKQNNLKVYTRDRAIYVNGITDAKDVVAVYGVDGKLHHRKPAGSAGLLRIDAAAYPAGIYMVSVEQKEGRVTRKVVISE